jgi:hypothetical protein
MSDVVYVVRAVDGGPVKIGRTRSDRVQQRLSELQTGNPSVLRCIAVLEGGRELEAELHWRFAHLKCGGGSEWFKVDNELGGVLAEWTAQADGETITPDFSRSSLRWTCDVCGRKIGQGRGAIGVSSSASWGAWNALNTHESNLQGDDAACRSALRFRTMAELAPAVGLRARWSAFHEECVGTSRDCWYAFEVERVSSWAQLLDLTLHLMGRVEGDASDWPQFLRSQLGDSWRQA